MGKYLIARFIPAGHILGSSFIEIEITEPGREPRIILFSGDIGRYHEPILVDPSPVAEADYLLVESTYGDRLHEQTDPKVRLAEVINSTVERGGKVIIPAFAVGRTQLLIYYLRELEEEGRIPVLPVCDGHFCARHGRVVRRGDRQPVLCFGAQGEVRTEKIRLVEVEA